MIMLGNGWQKLTIQSWCHTMVHLNPLLIEYLITVIPDFKNVLKIQKIRTIFSNTRIESKNKFARFIAIQNGSSGLINKSDRLIHKRINTLMTEYHKP